MFLLLLVICCCFVANAEIMRGKAADLMQPKAFGTCTREPHEDLRWGVDKEKAKEISCFNRHYAERSSYFLSMREFTNEANERKELLFYDTVNPTRLLFRAPVGRSMEEFLEESEKHGWPSFREQEVVWENVRVLPDGEAVSLDGTHLGHNLPDRHGNRLCINLVSIAGKGKPNDEL